MHSKNADFAHLQVKEVKDLILSAHDPALRRNHDKRFLFDIVANGINGIDVDKYMLIAALSTCGLTASKVLGDQQLTVVDGCQV